MIKKKIQLIDTHAHLDFPELFSRIDEVLKNARSNNVCKIVTISTNLNKINKIIKIAENNPEVFFTVGVHPNEVSKDINFINYELMKKLSSHPKCVGIGEGGLDYFYGYNNQEKQKQSFLTQIKVSRDTNLPLVIHARDADDDMIEILNSEYKQDPFKAILHCFSSGKKLAETGIKLGFFISFSGIVTFNSAKEIQSIAKKVPLNKILIETDSPYLAPTPIRGTVNEPKNCIHTAKFIAELKGLAFDDFAKYTYNNSINVFNKIIARRIK